MGRFALAFSFLASATLMLASGAVAADSFTENFVPKFKESCVGSAKQQSAAIPDAKVEAYCDCAAKRMSGFTDPEKDELMQTTQPLSPAMQQKMNDVVAQCGNETLR